ncbi:hypothetical protein ACFWWM_32860 [Streptomyces sp. NPDC058682]|uniref:hypothetical protein n=1 Tax=Streptomyces sp. NPDC058682 TaxID=3346596 RepID=UPI00364E3743
MEQIMRLVAALRRCGDHRLTRRMAAAMGRQFLPGQTMGGALTAGGDWQGGEDPATGIAGMTVSKLLSNGVAKSLVDQRRLPKEWI